MLALEDYVRDRAQSSCDSLLNIEDGYVLSGLYAQIRLC